MRNTKLASPLLRDFLITLNTDLDRVYLYSPDCYSDKSKETLVHRMVLLLEDRRFFSHRGIDIWSVNRELFRLLTFQRHGGASTIDMQLVRTLTGYKERTISRKLYEMVVARLLQYHFTKWQILDCYLSNAFFGTSLVGVEKASRQLYNKTPDKLVAEEAAMIASLLVYPRPLDPSPRWQSKVTRRANYALRLHTHFKKITK
jgi:membrane peptidoglycan carboxypeptidase